MEVSTLATRQADNSFSKADLVTIANNHVVLPAPAGASTAHTIQFDQQATGATLSTTVCGGDNEAVEEVTPRYYAKAQMGQMAVAYVDSLDWADNNLLDYEFLKFQTSAAGNAARFVVSGILNVTTDESYDPFETGAGKGGDGIVGAAVCYAALGGEMFD